MRFKQFIEVQVNRLFYPDTEEGEAEHKRDQAEAEETLRRIRSRQEMQRKPRSEPFVLTCWKGSSEEELDRMSREKGPNFRVIDNAKSRSGAIWFAHEFQNGGRENAESHGTVLITYFLKCMVYRDEVVYSDGTVEIQPNKEMAEKVQPYVESPIAIFGDMVLQTPSGWQFSEHGENHAICEIPLKITDDMLTSIS